MTKEISFIIRLFVLSAMFVIAAFGNTVSLDTTFNGTGYRLQSVIAEHSQGYSMVLQPDGKMLVGGTTNDNLNTQTSQRFAVIRMNSDGSLDDSFGNNGMVTTLLGFSASEGVLRLQPDGKILLAGTSYSEGNYYDFTVIRYNADGTLDTSFNGIGYAVQSFNESSVDEVRDMTIQADGKIILIGRTGQIPGIPNIEFNIGVMRFDADGSLDTGFNQTGMLTFGTPSIWEEAHAVITQADGKIIVGGMHRTTNEKFYLLRLNANGEFDTSFGNDGTAITLVGSGHSMISTLALQSDGKILAGGTEFIVRYATNGSVDTSFANNGIATAENSVGKIKVIAEDEFLVPINMSDAGVVRYLSNGALDTNFSRATVVVVPDANCFPQSLDVQTDGKIVLGGFCSGNSIQRFGAFRLQETRTKRFLDFNGDSLTDISIYRPSNGQWWYMNSFNLRQTVVGQFGTATDKPIPADFTGDGRADVAIFRPSTGEWLVLRSDNSTFYAFPFGTTGDIPIAADFDGDDKADSGVFRPSTNQWYIQKSTGGIGIATFGSTGDKPVPSDYDGDFKTDIAVYRPASGQWWVQRSSDGNVYAFEFGTSSDVPVQGDYTGDDKTDAAFWRPSTGEWFVRRSEDSSYYSMPFGLSDDLPTPGNFSADGRFDFAIYRPSTNTWHIQPTGGAYYYKLFGAPGDQPLPNVFVP